MSRDEMPRLTDEQQTAYDAIPLRTPLIALNSYDEGHQANIDRRWLIATEAVRRAVISSPIARHALIPFIASPLSETLPLDALNGVALEDTSVAQRIAQPALADYLQIPEYLILHSGLLLGKHRHSNDL